MKLSSIAEALGVDYSGGDPEIEGINSLSDARSDQISFITNQKYTKELENTQAAAVLVEEEFVQCLPKDCIALITDEPYLKLALATKLFTKPLAKRKGREPEIGENCTILPNVYLGTDVVIGNNVTLMSGVSIGDNVWIGDDTDLHPNVSIYPDCRIGSRCTLHAGVVIGSDGFGFAHTKDGRHIKIYQNGNVTVGNDVEIGANTTIDRAVFGSTIINDGCIIDNLVQIGHNCTVGENSILVSQVGLSGSTTLGRNVVMGGQSATAGHLEIGDFATIYARGGVTKSVDGGKNYSGFPLMDHREWLRLQGRIAKLLKR